MKIVVEHKPNCPKCKFTMNMLKDKGYKFEPKLVNPENDRKEIGRLLEQGFRSFPVVYIYSDSGTLLRSWDDVRTDEINKLQFIDE